MSFRSAKLPEPVNGRKSTSSHTSLGIPKKLKIGDKSFINMSQSPLALKRATATIMVTIYGKISQHKLKALFEPFIKVL